MMLHQPKQTYGVSMKYLNIGFFILTLITSSAALSGEREDAFAQKLIQERGKVFRQTIPEGELFLAPVNPSDYPGIRKVPDGEDFVSNISELGERGAFEISRNPDYFFITYSIFWMSGSGKVKFIGVVSVSDPQLRSLFDRTLPAKYLEGWSSVGLKIRLNYTEVTLITAVYECLLKHQPAVGSLPLVTDLHPETKRFIVKPAVVPYQGLDASEPTTADQIPYIRGAIRAGLIPFVHSPVNGDVLLRKTALANSKLGEPLLNAYQKLARGSGSTQSRTHLKKQITEASESASFEFREMMEILDTIKKLKALGIPEENIYFIPLTQIHNNLPSIN